MAIPVSDRLFRYSFSSPENARDLARNLLPPSYRRMVEGARVSVDNKSYIEAELREQLTDLLIRFDPPAEDPSSRDGGVGAPAGVPARQTGRAEGAGSLYLYVLVEHKSQPERWTTFQLLRYMLAVWSDVLRRERPEPERLPQIIPVVLYQGTRQWNSPLAFEALVDTTPVGGAQASEGREHQDPAAHTPSHIPRFEPLFVDLQSLPDKHLDGGVRAVVALLFLKYLARRIDREAARVLLDAMHREGVTRELREYFQAFYTALLRSKSPEEIEVFIAEAVQRRYYDSEEDLMTYAEKLETKGRVSDKQEVLIRQLSRKFEVSDAERERIRGVEEPDRLDAALDELVMAETKEAVLEKLL